MNKLLPESYQSFRIGDAAPAAWIGVTCPITMTFAEFSAFVKYNDRPKPKAHTIHRMVIVFTVNAYQIIPVIATEFKRGCTACSGTWTESIVVIPPRPRCILDGASIVNPCQLVYKNNESNIASPISSRVGPGVQLLKTSVNLVSTLLTDATPNVKPHTPLLLHFFMQRVQRYEPGVSAMIERLVGDARTTKQSTIVRLWSVIPRSTCGNDRELMRFPGWGSGRAVEYPIAAAPTAVNHLVGSTVLVEAAPWDYTLVRRPRETMRDFADRLGKLDPRILVGHLLAQAGGDLVTSRFDTRPPVRDRKRPHQADDDDDDDNPRPPTCVSQRKLQGANPTRLQGVMTTLTKTQCNTIIVVVDPTHTCRDRLFKYVKNDTHYAWVTIESHTVLAVELLVDLVPDHWVQRLCIHVCGLGARDDWMRLGKCIDAVKTHVHSMPDSPQSALSYGPGFPVCVFTDTAPAPGWYPPLDVIMYS